MALPVLDSMFSPLTAVAQTMKKAPVRLGYVYTPNGIIGCNDKSPKKFMWTPTAAGAELRVQPDDEVARAVPRQRRRLQRTGAGHRPGARRRSRRPRARDRDLAHRRASVQDRRRRLQARHLGRPDRGAGVRQADAARVARAGARAAGARRQLRLGLHLRVHVDVVARRDQPAARRNQSAHGVRAAVRRRREHRADRAHGTAREPEERARLRHRQPDAPAGQRSAPATSGSSTNISRRCAISSGAFSAPKNRTSR